MKKSPAKRKRSRLEVNVPLTSRPTSGEREDPLTRRLSTPDCMMSPVSHLRALTHDLEEGAKRRRAAQYLRESREAHLRGRRLYLVLDLDETLVHSLRSSVRQVQEEGGEAGGAAAGEGALEGGGDAEEGGESEEGEEEEDLTSEQEEEGEEAARVGEASGGREEGRHIGELSASAFAGAHKHGASAPSASAAEGAAGASEGQVTLRVQNVEFEMMLRPGVHAFLHEMSSLFAIHLYTMGSREYVQQALHHLDPTHTIFKPGQVLAWNPALDRTTKTLQRLLCVPELVLIVDDSPAAWSNHLSNLLLIDRFVGNPDDTSLSRVAHQLKLLHHSFFHGAPTASPHPTAPAPSAVSSDPPLSPLLESPSPSLPLPSAPAPAEPPPAPPPAPPHGRGSPAPSADAPSLLPPPLVPPLAPPLAPPLIPLLQPVLPALPAESASCGEMTADARQLLRAMCETVLEGVCCTFAGPTDFLTVDGVLPPEVMLAQRFGATFSSEIEPCVTHLLIPASSMSELVACERTSVLLSQAHSLGLLPKLRVLDARWLLDSIALCEKLPEEEYHILLPPC